MALEDRMVPYEILIRFDEQGALAGAHYIERRIVTLNGEVLKNEPGPAQPVDLAVQATGGVVLNEVLGKALTEALAAHERVSIALQNEVRAREAMGAEVSEF